jgi:hypothetical protein
LDAAARGWWSAVVTRISLLKTALRSEPSGTRTPDTHARGLLSWAGTARARVACALLLAGASALMLAAAPDRYSRPGLVAQLADGVVVGVLLLGWPRRLPRTRAVAVVMLCASLAAWPGWFPWPGVPGQLLGGLVAGGVLAARPRPLPRIQAVAVVSVCGLLTITAVALQPPVFEFGLAVAGVVDALPRVRSWLRAAAGDRRVRVAVLTVLVAVVEDGLAYAVGRYCLPRGATLQVPPALLPGGGAALLPVGLPRLLARMVAFTIGFLLVGSMVGELIAVGLRWLPGKRWIQTTLPSVLGVGAMVAGMLSARRTPDSALLALVVLGAGVGAALTVAEHRQHPRRQRRGGRP